MDPSEIPPDQPIESVPGYTPDFSKMQNQTVYVLIIVTLVVCVVLSTVAVILRAITRLWIVHRWGWDDTLAVISMFFNFGLTVSFAGMLKSGLAFDIHNTSLRTFMVHYFEGWTSWNATFTLILYFTFASIKLSILMLYLRLLGPGNKMLRYGVWVLVAIVFGVLLGTVIGLLKFCDPAGKLWKPATPGTCNVNAILFLAQAILQVVTDILILVPPIPIVWRLNAPTTRKFGFLATLCMGLFVTGIGIARLAMFVSQLKAKHYSVDISYLGNYLVIWEINFAIITICLPALRQLTNSVKLTVQSHLSKNGQSSNTPHINTFHMSPNGRASTGVSSSNKNKNRSSLTQFLDGPYRELDDRTLTTSWDEDPEHGKISEAPARVTIRSKLEDEEEEKVKKTGVGMAV